MTIHLYILYYGTFMDHSCHRHYVIIVLHWCASRGNLTYGIYQLWRYFEKISVLLLRRCFFSAFTINNFSFRQRLPVFITFICMHARAFKLTNTRPSFFNFQLPVQLYKTVNYHLTIQIVVKFNHLVKNKGI